MPYANAVGQAWLSQAEPWLSANVPDRVRWAMPSHLGFWDRPAEFDERLMTFLSSGR